VSSDPAPTGASSPADPVADPVADEVARLRRQLERERAARAQAEDIAEAATRRLYRALERLEQEQADVRDLAISAAHDVLNPLTSLVGFADLLQRADLEPASRDMVEGRMKGTAQYAVALVRSLFDVLRVVGEDGPHEAVPVRQVLEDLKVDLLGRHPDVRLEWDEDVDVEVQMARPQLQRLLDNLIENAARYAGARPVVRVGVTSRGDGEVVLSVSDDGPGVPAADRERIFEIFARAGDAEPSAERHPVPAGRGVGLTVCRRIARAVGGDVWLDDRAGPLGGAAFMVRLPTGG
jgi:signal transduction histidine kinase